MAVLCGPSRCCGCQSDSWACSRGRAHLTATPPTHPSARHLPPARERARLPSVALRHPTAAMPAGAGADVGAWNRTGLPVERSARRGVYWLCRGGGRRWTPHLCPGSVARVPRVRAGGCGVAPAAVPLSRLSFPSADRDPEASQSGGSKASADPLRTHVPPGPQTPPPAAPCTGGDGGSAVGFRRPRPPTPRAKRPPARSAKKQVTTATNRDLRAPSPRGARLLQDSIPVWRPAQGGCHDRRKGR